MRKFKVGDWVECLQPSWITDDFYGKKYVQIVSINDEQTLLGFICNPRFNPGDYAAGRPNFPIGTRYGDIHFKPANKVKTKLGKVLYESSNNSIDRR